MSSRDPNNDVVAAKSPDPALTVLRRGMTETPTFRVGLIYTVLLALVGAIGSVLIPILIQQVLDRGLLGPQGFRPGFVYTVCSLTGVGIVGVYWAQRQTYRRMVRASETALAQLRVRVFEHIHSLSIAEQTAERRGAFVSRVTSDIDTLTEFMEWGALAWITGSTLIFVTTIAMFLYSWQLALVILITIAPMFFVLKALQKAILSSYELVRTRVAEMLSEISESVMGAAVVRAYGIEDRMDRRLKRAIQNRYDAQIYSNRYMSVIFPISDVFGAAAMAAALAIGATFGPGWGLTPGKLVAFLFLATLFVQPLGELSETFDQTQTAIAGWRKVLGVLDIPLELVEPNPGIELPHHALEIRAEGIEFDYRDGQPVLVGVDVFVPAGAQVAIVGETGCGKTTFAKLLCRLADPTEGRISIGGIDLREVAPESRRSAIRMVPQDGFLFDASVRDNVRFGRPEASDDDVAVSFESLGLSDWVDGLPRGLDTRVGERGSNLSVGEAQLVALARAQIADPGVLILDEATSAVDPETERVLGQALRRLSEGRTTITIAHRLSTAEGADFVIVFDAGRVVEVGRHDELAAAGGIYASLYRSWLGNTRQA